ARRGLRGGGQAARHARHVRSLCGLQGCVLSQGAEGAASGARRLQPGLRGVRRDRRPDLTDASVPGGRAQRRPLGDVPVRRLHDRRQPGGPAGDQRAVRLHSGRLAGGLAAGGAAVRGGKATARRAYVRARDGLAHSPAAPVSKEVGMNPTNPTAEAQAPLSELEQKIEALAERYRTSRGEDVDALVELTDLLPYSDGEPLETPWQF